MNILKIEKILLSYGQAERKMLFLLFPYESVDANHWTIDLPRSVLTSPKSGWLSL